MNRTTYLIGDVRDRLAEIPDCSVDLVLTSPPFLALRSYLPDDHPDKHREIGSEPTPAEFLATLLGLTGEFDRVLAPHGSIAVELGDTYSGSGAGPDARRPNGEPELWKDQHRRRDERHTRGGDDEATRRRASTKRDGMAPHPGWPPAKSLCLVPQLYAASLAYGRNLLTGEPCDPWRVRNWITWGRPNPPVGALGDKVRPASSFFTVACKSGKRWFDLDAVRGPGSSNTHARPRVGVDVQASTGKAADDERRGGNFSTLNTLHMTDGAPPLDWWTDPYDDDELATALLIEATQPYKGAHYATWPEAVARRFVLIMCPERVCATCGTPSTRITERDSTGQNTRKSRGYVLDGRQVGAVSSTDVPDVATVRTVGWSDCGHDTWRAGVVLDPFAGSGTTLAVAHRNGRDSIGIDLDPRNEALFHERLARHEGGLFLESDAVEREDDPTLL